MKLETTKKFTFDKVEITEAIRQYLLSQGRIDEHEAKKNIILAYENGHIITAAIESLDEL